ncbi:MAG: hypothetical protein ACFFFT_00025 [Candidatus Thorarchaeota archaeon]
MIDKEFIEKWAHQYSYSSKIKYSDILIQVQEDIQKTKNISKTTFENIIRWKAKRNFNNVNWSQFELYSEAIRDVLTLPESQKIFKKAIIEIAKYTKKGLREIDKALFAYDKFTSKI